MTQLNYKFQEMILEMRLKDPNGLETLATLLGLTQVELVLKTF